jgi:hypothetical protein
MGKQHRLPPLEVGVPWHDHIAVPPGQANKGTLAFPDFAEDSFDGGGKIEALIQCHLIVPAARSVQCPSTFTDHRAEH